MRHILAAMVVLGCLAVSSQAASPPGAASRADNGKGIIEFKHLRLDLAKRAIEVDAEVCLREGQLELLLCTWGQKTHESILHTRATPSSLHAALLGLGLTPGKPAEWIISDVDDEGRFVPPRGGGVQISIRWRDEAGKIRQINAADMLKASAEVKPAKSWIFVGSQVSPTGRYWADSEGNIISVANFASSVIDVPFQSHDKAELLSFSANTATIPPLKTKVQVLISPMPGAEKAPHARAMLIIGPLGHVMVDGQAVDPGKLTEWAQKFTARHAKGQVVIIPHPRSLAADVARVRTELRIGGVHYFDHRWHEAPAPVPPRTFQWASVYLADWRKKFANPSDYIHDPGKQARAELARINAELVALEDRHKLLRQYAQDLAKSLDGYEPPATSAP